MFNDLIEATARLINSNTLIPKAEYPKKEYELYLEKELLQCLNLLFDNKYKRQRTYSSPNGLPNRIFDISRVTLAGIQVEEVCEVGHERSNQEYSGLINKFFFDHIKNFQFEGFRPKSYTWLFFTIDNQNHLDNANNMFDLIANSLNGRLFAKFDVVKNGITFGKIIVIDKMNDIGEVRNVWNTNRDNLFSNIIALEEYGGFIWNKLGILDGICQPWSVEARTPV
jgi:hypothetical protein